jgi:hypothetical protein
VGPIQPSAEAKEPTEADRWTPRELGQRPVPQGILVPGRQSRLFPSWPGGGGGQAAAGGQHSAVGQHDGNGNLDRFSEAARREFSRIDKNGKIIFLILRIKKKIYIFSRMKIYDFLINYFCFIFFYLVK